MVTHIQTSILGITGGVSETAIRTNFACNHYVTISAPLCPPPPLTPPFFTPLRNQAMRKKLILYFKRRNHARKQWVSRQFNILDTLPGPGQWQMTDDSCENGPAAP